MTHLAGGQRPRHGGLLRGTRLRVWDSIRARVPPNLFHGIVALGLGAFLGLLAAKVPPLTLVMLVAGVVLLYAVARAPEVGLLAIVLLTSGLVPSERQPQIPVGPFDLTSAEVILLFQLGLCLITPRSYRSGMLGHTPLGWPLTAFLFVVCLSAGAAVLVWSAELFFVISRLRMYMFYGAFYIVATLVTTPRQLRRLVWGLYLIAAALTVMALASARSPSFNPSGTLADSLMTAGRRYEGVVRVSYPGVSLMYIMLVASVSEVALGHGASLLRGVLRALALAPGILLHFQRNLWLTIMIAIAGLAVLSGWKPRLRLVRAALLSGLVVGALLLPLSSELGAYAMATRDRFGWGLSPSVVKADRSAQLRIIETGYALETLAEHPVFGVGVARPYRPTVPEDGYWRESSGRDLRYFMHNVYLWVAVQVGGIGLAPFALFLLLALARGLGRWKQIQDPWQRSLVLGLSLALGGQIISNAVMPSMLESPALVVYPIIIGIGELILYWNPSASAAPAEGT